jgi:hypothetical protein
MIIKPLKSSSLFLSFHLFSRFHFIIAKFDIPNHLILAKFLVPNSLLVCN